LTGQATHLQDTRAHCGAGSVVLGGADNGVGTLSQSFTIARTATSATLTFFLEIVSRETATRPLDVLTVEVRNASTGTSTTLAAFSNLQRASGYSQRGGFDLLAFRGQTLRLLFRATTDERIPTSFRIDDVSVK